MIAVASLAIYLGGWPFRLLVAAGAAAMMLEWGDMHRAKRGWTYVGVALLLGLALVLVEYLFPAANAIPPRSTRPFSTRCGPDWRSSPVSPSSTVPLPDASALDGGSCTSPCRLLHCWC
jgi:hypothetical protein